MPNDVNHIDVIHCYALTEEHNDEDKVKFYNFLQSVINRIRKYNLLLMMGNFNAKVGCDNQGIKRAMEKHGWESMTRIMSEKYKKADKATQGKINGDPATEAGAAALIGNWSHLPSD